MNDVELLDSILPSTKSDRSIPRSSSPGAILSVRSCTEFFTKQISILLEIVESVRKGVKMEVEEGVQIDDKAKRMRDLLSSFYSPDSSSNASSLENYSSSSSRFATLDTINTTSFDADLYMNLLVCTLFVLSLVFFFFGIARSLLNSVQFILSR